MDSHLEDQIIVAPAHLEKNEWNELEFPYPGLRPFGPGDSAYFFGRENQTSELFKQLEKKNFVVVSGPSGSGKSSLVRSGLVPYLCRPSEKLWQVVEMRIGNNPFGVLADELYRARHDHSPTFGVRQSVVGRLRRPGVALADVLQELELLKSGDSPFLLIVDQFEEVFRYAREVSRSNAEAFVGLLIKAATDAQKASGTKKNIHILLTMRTDFLALCPQFSGLPDLLNNGLFLTPQLRFEQIEEAIERPALYCGGGVDRSLTAMLLTDIASVVIPQTDYETPEADQLPLLQHALRRLWKVALLEAKDHDDELLRLSSVDYLKISGTSSSANQNAPVPGGRLAATLDNHIEEIYSKVTNQDTVRAVLTEWLFRCLTERFGGLETRRPQTLRQIALVAVGALAHSRNEDELRAKYTEVLQEAEYFAAREQEPEWVQARLEAQEEALHKQRIAKETEHLTGKISDEAITAFLGTLAVEKDEHFWEKQSEVLLYLRHFVKGLPEGPVDAESIKKASQEELIRVTEAATAAEKRIPGSVDTVLEPIYVELRAIIDSFREDDHAILSPLKSVVSDIGPTTSIDLVHEVVIRRWRRLRFWLEAEYRDRERFDRIEEADYNHRALLSDVDLNDAKDWKEFGNATLAWALQYSTFVPGSRSGADTIEQPSLGTRSRRQRTPEDFKSVLSFIDRSETKWATQVEADKRNEEIQKKLEQSLIAQEIHNLENKILVEENKRVEAEALFNAKKAKYDKNRLISSIFAAVIVVFSISGGAFYSVSQVAEQRQKLFHELRDDSTVIKLLNNGKFKGALDVVKDWLNDPTVDKNGINSGVQQATSASVNVISRKISNYGQEPSVGVSKWLGIPNNSPANDILPYKGGTALVFNNSINYFDDKLHPLQATDFSKYTPIRTLWNVKYGSIEKVKTDASGEQLLILTAPDEKGQNIYRLANPTATPQLLAGPLSGVTDIACTSNRLTVACQEETSDSKARVTVQSYQPTTNPEGKWAPKPPVDIQPERLAPGKKVFDRVDALKLSANGSFLAVQTNFNPVQWMVYNTSSQLSNNSRGMIKPGTYQAVDFNGTESIDGQASARLFVAPTSGAGNKWEIDIAHFDSTSRTATNSRLALPTPKDQVSMRDIFTTDDGVIGIRDTSDIMWIYNKDSTLRFAVCVPETAIQRVFFSKDNSRIIALDRRPNPVNRKRVFSVPTYAKPYTDDIERLIAIVK